MLTYRKYRVIKKVKESKLAVSLYLQPVENNPLSEFRPGQHLMFKLRIPGHEIPTFRNYSFSDAFHKEYYRISVKKELPPVNSPMLPEGLCSSYIFDQVNEGDILEAKGPSGEFCLDPNDNKPIVLIAGGIGITPLLCILKSISLVNPRREVYFFYGVNEKCEHSFKSELNELKKSNPCFRIVTFYTQVKEGDIEGQDYDYHGFINIETIVKQTRDINIDHFLCGPGSMMNYITEELISLGVDKSKIHTESFNINSTGPSIDFEEHQLLQKKEVLIDTTEFSIEFRTSNKKFRWDNRYSSILEFAEANNIEISSGCLFGDCGTCLTKIQEGTIKYMHPTMVKPEEGKCLPCSCIPASNLVLEV